ncbi:hypothetical protein Acy02nite_58040 [Actinoplanes cyaneus]|uniref:Double-GTPase 2 domain-containing protein n=1 Tax=Actinoplanes cyaneus TaxID=52696 RepID=A0A919IM51_9ACTN|nr:DUF4407 domain-containing protein [Actinoplanes cyaneus]MCW2139789.1 protein of unknown function (DUF4407) [Actinoplanes cyaneus]GID67923.1 hypothetical protein Acy02nite_58040 [Actinoplanes cyaneus]
MRDESSDQGPRIVAGWGPEVQREHEVTIEIPRSRAAPDTEVAEGEVVEPTRVRPLPGGEPPGDEPWPRRFVLYASGVDRRILARAAVDESEFVVQGSLVVLTSIVAVVAALSAAGVLVEGRFAVTPVTVLIGLAWGVLIFFFDRALVSGTLNPFHFSRADIGGFSDPHRFTNWAHETAGRGAGTRMAEVIKVLSVASLRIALALATSFIMADMILLLIFQAEVGDRTEYLQERLHQKRVETIQQDYVQRAKDRSARREQLTGAGDPQLDRLGRDLDQLEKRLTDARADLVKLQDAAAKEEDGVARRYQLSDGTVISTTGGGGSGPATRTFADQAATQESLVSDLTGKVSDGRDALGDRRGAILRENKLALEELTRQDNAAPGGQQSEIDKVPGVNAAEAGLLLRRAALTDLEHDTDPQTPEQDAIPPCRGFFRWLCSLRNWVAPPTPMGPEVVAFRIVFLVIEIFPITYKVFMSLRRRRPYDMVKASMEVEVYATAFDRADRSLHQGAAQVVTRVNERRDWRVRELTDHPDTGRLLDIDEQRERVLTGTAQPGLADLNSAGSDEETAGRDPRHSAEGGGRHRPGNANLRRPTFKVVMVGGQRAGKTALLAMMYEELSRDRGNARGYLLRCQDPEQQEELVANARRVAEAGAVWPPKTALDEIEEYTFTCRISNEPVLDVHYWDYAGDLYEQPSRESRSLRRKLHRVVKQADALLLAVDGEIVLKAMLGREAFGVDPGDAATVLKRMTENLFYVGSDDRDQVAHLLITKWDLFESRGIPLTAVRDFLLAEMDIRELIAHRTVPVRLIPVASTGHEVTPETHTDGVITMVKQRDRPRSPINLSVLLTALLPDRIEAIVNDMSDRTFARRIKQAKRDRRKFWGVASLSWVLGFAGRFTKIDMGFFAFEKEAANPENGWALAAFQRKAQSLKGSAGLVKELQDMRKRAGDSVLARINVVHLLRRDLAAFERRYPGSTLPSGERP